MTRRDFLQNGAMAVVTASVAPVAVLSVPQFATGGIVSGKWDGIVGERVCESTITHEQMARIEALLGKPDYFITPELLTGGRPYELRSWPFEGAL